MPIDLRSSLGLTPVFALFAASACVVVSSDDDDAAGSTSMTTASTTTASTSAGEGTATTSGGTETTGAMVDPEEVCGQITDIKECAFYEDEHGREIYCDWVTPTTVTLDGSTCVLDEAEGSCLAVTGATTAAGCAPTPGCDGEPYYREVDGEVRVLMQCGGSPPVGYEPCTYVEPGVFEPAECGCLCDETDSTSTGPGDESSSSGGSTGSTSG
jgi:hypothetical protein